MSIKRQSVFVKVFRFSLLNITYYNCQLGPISNFIVAVVSKFIIFQIRKEKITIPECWRNIIEI